MEPIPWEQLFELADRTIKETIEKLPEEIKPLTNQVPYILDQWCPSGDNLGEFHGFEEGALSDANGPIFIFIGEHFELCQEEGLDFATEIRKTYLHELCHHFGLDEGDIEARGLA